MGSLKIYRREKGRTVKISEGRKGMPIFLDATERLSICQINNKPYVSKVPYFLVQ